MSDGVVLNIQVKDSQKHIEVKVEGLSTSCEILASELKRQLNAKFITLTYLPNTQIEETIDLSRPISCYYDINATYCLFVQKLNHFNVNINQQLVYENGFENPVRIADIISVLNKNHFQLGEFTYTLLDNRGKKIILNAAGQSEQSYQKLDLKEYSQPIHLQIKCQNIDQRKQKLIQQPFMVAQQEKQQLLEYIQQLEDQYNQISKTMEKIFVLKNDIIKLDDQALHQWQVGQQQYADQSQRFYTYQEQVKQSQEFQDNKLSRYTVDDKFKNFQNNSKIQFVPSNQFTSTNQQMQMFPNPNNQQYNQFYSQKVTNQINKQT